MPVWIRFYTEKKKKLGFCLEICRMIISHTDLIFQQLEPATYPLSLADSVFSSPRTFPTITGIKLQETCFFILFCKFLDLEMNTTATWGLLLPQDQKPCSIISVTTHMESKGFVQFIIFASSWTQGRKKKIYCFCNFTYSQAQVSMPYFSCWSFLWVPNANRYC